MADLNAGSAGSGTPHVAIIFDNFGPYHVARLSAAAEAMDVTGIEVGGQSAEYAWDRPASGGLRRVALFPGPSRKQPRKRIVATMEAALDRLSPDAIAIPGWADNAGLAALRWGLRHKVPVVVMSESNQADHGRQAFREAVKRRLVGLCSAGLAGGAMASAYLAELGMPVERVAIGYDVIDNAYFAAGAAAARADAVSTRAALVLPDRFFLTCCRLVEKKNIAFLLDAFADYRRAEPVDTAWSLVIAGDGPLMPELTAHAARLGLGDAVHFTGFTQYDGLPKLYGLASAFVLPSTTEQWGLVVNEAMAAGLPVLVSERCGCAADLVIDGRNGARFDPADRPGLARTLRELAHAPDLQAMGTRSETIVADFSPARFASGLRSAVSAGQAGPVRASGIGRMILSAMLR